MKFQNDRWMEVVWGLIAGCLGIGALMFLFHGCAIVVHMSEVR